MLLFLFRLLQDGGYGNPFRRTAMINDPTGLKLSPTARSRFWS